MMPNYRKPNLPYISITREEFEKLAPDIKKLIADAIELAQKTKNQKGQQKPDHE